MTGRRIALAGFSLESNSFTGLSTTLEQFRVGGGEFLVGNEVLAHHRSVNTVLAGFQAATLAEGWTPVPLISARASPGGPLTDVAFERISGELLERARVADADGLLVSLHGAMLTESVDDPDGLLLAELRKVLGDKPIVAVLDLHANVTRRMVESATALVAYREYPHTDLRESGLRAAAILTAAIRRPEGLERAFRPLASMLPSINMRTTDPASPYARLQARAREIMAEEPSVLEIGLYGGFPYADVESPSASLLVYTSGGPELATVVAEDLQRRFLDTRHEFFRAIPAIDGALRSAAGELARHGGPIVLADIADNPGSGGSGDTTGFLHSLAEGGALPSGARQFLGILYDPETVVAAWEAGEGAVLEAALGGKVNSGFGEPFRARMQVVVLSEGRYRCVGPMNTGQERTLGRSALLRLGSLEVAVSEGRSSVDDPAMIGMFGRRVADYDVLALKVKGHFRAAFEPLVRAIVPAEAPGAAMTDFTALPYTKLSQGLYPINKRGKSDARK